MRVCHFATRPSDAEKVNTLIRASSTARNRAPSSPSNRPTVTPCGRSPGTARTSWRSSAPGSCAALARVETAEQAADVIAAIRKQHWDATHHCSAFRIGANAEQQRSNDDGEPAGTAGVPMLEVLSRREITDTVAVVTRYYGGIKLGAGGLVRAYGQVGRDGTRRRRHASPSTAHHRRDHGRPPDGRQAGQRAAQCRPSDRGDRVRQRSPAHGARPDSPNRILRAMARRTHRGSSRRTIRRGTAHRPARRVTAVQRLTHQPQHETPRRSNRSHRGASPLRSIVEGVVDGLRPDAGPVPGSASAGRSNRPDSSSDDITEPNHRRHRNRAQQ